MEDLQKMAEIFGPWGAIVLITIYLIFQAIKERNSLKKEEIGKADEIEFQRIVKKQISETTSSNKEIIKYLKISSEKYADEINESQVRILVDTVFSCSETDIRDYILRIIKDNHIIGQEREITAKIKTYISNRYHKDSILMKEFKYEGKCLSGIMKEAWRDYLIETMVELVLSQKGEKAIISTIENAFESFRYDMLDGTL
jgi:hypothetical protein